MNYLFDEQPIDELFRTAIDNIKRSVNQIDEYRKENNDTSELARELSAKFALQTLDIDLADRTVEVKMVNLSAERFPASYDVQKGRSYPRAKVIYKFNLKSDNNNLLTVRPKNASLNNSIPADISGNTFTISYQTLFANSVLNDEVKNEVRTSMRQTIKDIENIIPIVNKQVSEFNEELVPFTKNLLDKRLKQIQAIKKQKDDLNKL